MESGRHGPTFQRAIRLGDGDSKHTSETWSVSSSTPRSLLEDGHLQVWRLTTRPAVMKVVMFGHVSTVQT
jgi:hypothetical protein